MVTGPVQQPFLVVRRSAALPRPAGLPAGQHPTGLPGDPRPAGLAGDLHALARVVAVASTAPRWRGRVLVRLGPVGQGFAGGRPNELRGRAGHLLRTLARQRRRPAVAGVPDGSGW
ncbi:hypothetical protein [Micromonospora sp. 067-2]|uniref:hypothetical protein n=1 Tax=Micromonospora sp. 067-2 TaxID=2789270 RepID=UPI00397CF6F2